MLDKEVVYVSGIVDGGCFFKDSLVDFLFYMRICCILFFFGMRGFEVVFLDGEVKVSKRIGEVINVVSGFVLSSIVISEFVYYLGVVV